MIALVMLFVLAGGTTLSILTTTDSGWWRLHFSELGTFSDFSGYVFNATLITTGLIIAAFAVRVHLDLRALTPVRRVKPSRVFGVFLLSVGVNLLCVGVVPLNTNSFLHDRAASGVTLSFLGMLVMVFVRRRHVPRQLLQATAGTLVSLGATIAAFATAMINLAALEAVAFTLIGIWVTVFLRCLGGGMTPRTPAPSAQSAESLSPKADGGLSIAGRSAITGCVPVYPTRSAAASAILLRNAYHPAISSGMTTTRDASTHLPVSENPIVTSTNTRNARVSHAVNGAPNSRNDGRCSLPSRAQRCSFIWHSTMVAQPPTMPSAETSSTISKAFEGAIAFRPTPRSVITAVSTIPPYGTPLRDILSVNRGAEPLTAIDRRMRPVEYSPALRLESAAVSTTKFMTDAEMAPA